MVRPRTKEVGKVITVTMSPDTRTCLDFIAKEEKRSMSEIVTGLITKEYNLRKGGEGALRILDAMVDDLIILVHFRDRQKDIKPFLKLHDDIDAIRRELPEYQKQQDEKIANLEQHNKLIMKANEEMHKRGIKDETEQKKFVQEYIRKHQTK